jgi:hypothetical protein
MQPLRRFVRRAPAGRVAFHETPSPRRPLVAVPNLPDEGIPGATVEEVVACRIRPRKGMEWRGRRYAKGEILELPMMAGFVLHLCEVVEMLPGYRAPVSMPVPVLVESVRPTPVASTQRPIAA